MHALTSKTSAEVFEDLKNLRGECSVFVVLGNFVVFARFRMVLFVCGKVFEVLAWKRNGLGGILFKTITFPYGNIPNLSVGCFRTKT